LGTQRWGYTEEERAKVTEWYDWFRQSLYSPVRVSLVGLGMLGIGHKAILQVLDRQDSLEWQEPDLTLLQVQYQGEPRTLLQSVRWERGTRWADLMLLTGNPTDIAGALNNLTPAIAKGKATIRQGEVWGIPAALPAGAKPVTLATIAEEVPATSWAGTPITLQQLREGVQVPFLPYSCRDWVQKVKASRHTPTEVRRLGHHYYGRGILHHPEHTKVPLGDRKQWHYLTTTTTDRAVSVNLSRMIGGAD